MAPPAGAFVEIIEVGSRDGLQSQPKLLDTETKVEFIEHLVTADTIGVAVPSDASALLDRVKAAVNGTPLRFHDTRNTGAANVYAAVQSGIRIIDASWGASVDVPLRPAPRATWRPKTSST